MAIQAKPERPAARANDPDFIDHDDVPPLL
jgi:hypothetical protein